MKRRDFVKTGIIASQGLFLFNHHWSCAKANVRNQRIDDYYKGFRNPPVESKPFVRWWWNGNMLDKNEILRELDVLESSGIGGVEINPIAFPEGAEDLGGESLMMFEDEWLRVLQIALIGAKERGIICDMIVGSGWPFGGEFLKREHQTQMVTIETILLEGEKRVSLKLDELLDRVDPQFHSKSKAAYKELLMIRLVPSNPKGFIEGEDLTYNFEDEILAFDVPPGKYILYYVVKLTGYMAVINGAPGASGPVLNHYNKYAVENYLNRISSLINSEIGGIGDYIRAMFCDSMELEGANWNDDLPDEFEKRNGYSLLPYLPFVLKKVGHMGNPVGKDYGALFPDDVVELLKRVELDFYKIRLELFKERFLDTFNEWCHENNVLSRVQAYGRGFHPLEASMAVDIPECETWIFRDVGKKYPEKGLVGRAPTMINKYVASASALSGKKIVSCEEITNTTMVFMAALEDIKIAGDQSNISGVNHSILHGFNYSPPEVPFPGWVRYGTFFSERNTWWPFFKLWTQYKARVSYMLQNAIPEANVAILQPLNDLWMKEGPQRDPFPQKWYPWYQHNLWEVIHQNGGGCDYVSENIINSASFINGKMAYNNRSYHTLLMPEILSLDKKTAHSLLSFAKVGGRIVFIGTKPFKSISFKNSSIIDSDIRRIMDELFDSKNRNVTLYPSPRENVISWYSKLQDKIGIEPYVSFSNTNKFLNQSTFRLGKHWMFFITNSSDSKPISVEADFLVEQDYYPWIWDAETGRKFRYPTKNNNRTLKLELPKATSILIVYEKEQKGEMFKPQNFYLKGKQIKGEWQLYLNHIDGDQSVIVLNIMKDLIDDNRTRNFAGEVVYEKVINVDKTDYNYIDLGEVKGVSELSLNGEKLGTRWYGDHVYNIGNVLKKGENRLSVKLTTITGNYLKKVDHPLTRRWTKDQAYCSMGIIGPVRIL